MALDLLLASGGGVCTIINIAVACILIKVAELLRIWERSGNTLKVYMKLQEITLLGDSKKYDINLPLGCQICPS